MADDPFISELLAVAQRNVRGNVHSSVLPTSGGWCAPSETVWGLHDVAQGMLEIPTMAITRGGIKWPLRQVRARPLPKFEDCPSFGPPIGMLKPLELGIFI